MKISHTFLANGVAIGAWILTSFLSAAESFSEESRPNIVMIVIDTLRAANLSHAGYDRLTSPAIDELASRSVVFRNTVSIGANTTIAMAGLMTGRLPHFEFGEPWTDEYFFGMRRFYSREGEIGLPTALDSLAERLRNAGYFTAGVVTNPYLQSSYQFDQGFMVYEELMEENGYVAADVVTDSALSVLDAVKRSEKRNDRPMSERAEVPTRDTIHQPFFLYLHYMDVHGPYKPRERPEDCFDESKHPRVLRPMTASDWREWKRWWNMDRDVSKPERQQLLSTMKSRYDCEIRFVDQQLGRVLKRIRELGLEDKTIIAITSDHGEEFLEHGGTMHKGTVYEELIRVPLILFVPGVGSHRVDDLVRNFDLYPTLLQLADVELEAKDVDAVSLLPLVYRKDVTLGLAAYTSFPWARMYLAGNEKIIERPNRDLAIFDLERDPGELNPISSTDASVTQKTLKNRLDALVDRLRGDRSELKEAKNSAEGSPQGHGPDEATRNQLRALGYLE